MLDLECKLLAGSTCSHSFTRLRIGQSSRASNSWSIIS